MKKRLHIFITLFGIALMGLMPAKSQAQMIGLDLQVGVPTGEFRQNTNAVGIGGALSALFPFADRVPIYFGVELGYMNYGIFSQTLNQNLVVLNTNIPLRFRVQTNNNLLNGHAVLRFVAPIQRIQIYADALVGGRYIYTRTQVFNESPTNSLNINTNTYNEAVQARTNVDDWIFSYGGGGGVMIGQQEFKLNLRVVYLFGSQAEYLDRKTVEQWNATNPPVITLNSTTATLPESAVPTKNSTTDMFFISAGLTIAF
ncbi:MAG: hypothetical protein EAZ55_06380 [Cytophagales bacterium]|nr:MAG: hypothetical protein EAZ55_06380 [Cytophagales bacterium]